MGILSSLLISYMIFDFMPKSAVPEATRDSTSYMEAGSGELSVTIQQVDAGSVPRGATRVEVAVLNFAASCEEDVSVEGIDLLHTGAGDSVDIQGVYLSDGLRRVSRVQRFDQSGIARLRVKGVIIPKCSAERLSVLVDLSTDASAGGEHGVTLQRSSAVRSSAKIVTFREADDSRVVVMTPYRIGTIAVNFLPVNKRLSYGRTETVARIQLTADSKGSHYLHELTLTNTENARDMDLINFRLESRSGELLSGPATRMHGKNVRIPFDPSFLLSRSQTVVLLLKAEIRGSVRKKVNFTLEEPGDLVATPARER